MLLFNQGLLCAGLLAAAVGPQCPEQGGPQAEALARFAAGEEYAGVLFPPVVTVWSGTCAPHGKACTIQADCCLLNSEDQPQSSTPIAAVSLHVEVKVPLAAKEARHVDCVELFLDSQLFDRRRCEGTKSCCARFQFCPQPGKHVLYARYRYGNVWSDFSNPLLMDVQFPAAPEIVAVSGDGTTLGPLRPAEPVTVDGRWLTLKLGNVARGDLVAVYLDGERTAERPIPTNDVCALQIHLDQPPGVYALTARVLPARYGYQVASLPSREVMIRLRPDNGCARLVSPPCSKKCGQGGKNCASRDKTDEQELAFSAVPSPQPIPLQDERDSGQSKLTQSDSKQCGKLPCAHWFASAAHFPLRDFGARGEVIGREGAVIYEGMRFSHNDQGRYEVSFLVGTPAAPTTLRFRFLVQICEADGPVWHTLTLPPISIQPHQDGSSNPQPAVWRICHQGYSPMLACTPGRIIAIRREGTARFGFGASL
jgi:hypothetical protein